MTAAPDRTEIITMLAGLRARSVAEVDDRIDSLELAWLVHQVEQRYGVPIDEDDEEQLAGIRTVDDAVRILGEVVGGRPA